MRIIGGQAGGQKIRAPRGRNTRPTSDRVREALFSILESRPGGLASLVVLDLFAGSGALGFEALSRGADRATLVEHDPHCARVIRANAAQLGYGTRCQVMVNKVRKALVKLQQQQSMFHLILIDPPYALDPAPVLEDLASRQLLLEGGQMVLEHDKRVDPPNQAGGLSRVSQRKYGDTVLSFYNIDSR